MISGQARQAALRYLNAVRMAYRHSFVFAAVLAAAAVAAACGSNSTASSEPQSDAGPERLSASGLYSDIRARTLAPGVIRFAPAYPLWADGAEKSRYLLLPPGGKVDTTDMDNWIFPVGTKAWKEFWVDGKLVETRLLWKRAPAPGIDSWWQVAYVWSPDGSDAIANVDGVPSALGTSHDVPSQDDCKYCHMNVRDAVIGFSAFELSVARPSVDRTAGDEPAGLLLPLAKQGLFTNPPAADFAVPGSGAVREVLAYFHGNCGFCHNDQLNALINRTIRFRLLASETTPEQTGAYTTTVHTKMRHAMPNGADEAVVPGHPDKSQVYARMIDADLMRMPPKGTKVVDAPGAALIRDWILSLPQ